MREGGGAETQDARYVRISAEYRSAIERLARGYEADSELARDLVQEIHVALWRSLAYFEGQCSERSWVYRVAHNIAVTHLIKRKRLSGECLASIDELGQLAGAELDDPEQALGQRRLVERLLSTIHRLRPADRQVMLLYLEDLSAAEIAEVTGLSAGAVAVRIHRIKAILCEPYQEREAGR
jgi:RNA polymerase sigma factor (sigma-70 family)